MQKPQPSHLNNSFWVLMLIIVFLIGPTSCASDETAETWRILSTIKSKNLNEISGLAASNRNEHILWTHNDSGDSATFYAISKQGQLQARFHLSNIHALDFEDMALAPGMDSGNDPDDPTATTDYLYIGDIGDNKKIRPNITIHRIPEPTVQLRTGNDKARESTLTDVTSLWLRYPDKAKDAEALIVDPTTNDIYIFSKEKKRSRIYRASYPQNPQTIKTMEYLGEIPIEIVTAADISYDGLHIIIRNYKEAWLWSRKENENLTELLTTQKPVKVKLPRQPQGESICFAPTAHGLYTISENKKQPIYYLDLK